MIVHIMPMEPFKPSLTSCPWICLSHHCVSVAPLLPALCQQNKCTTLAIIMCPWKLIHYSFIEMRSWWMLCPSLCVCGNSTATFFFKPPPPSPIDLNHCVPLSVCQCARFYLLNCSTVVNQTWHGAVLLWAVVSCRKNGLLSSRSSSQQGFI